MIEEHPTCACTNMEVRVRTCADGRKQYVKQCQVCGRSTSPIAKVLIRVPDLVPPLDELIIKRWDDKWREYQGRQRAVSVQRAAEKSKSWWDAYDEYRLTPEWLAKRDKVLERDHHLCQGCFSRRAIAAHHLTYKHVGCEFLFELIAVCAECHQRLHPPEERGSS